METEGSGMSPGRILPWRLGASLPCQFLDFRFPASQTARDYVCINVSHTVCYGSHKTVIQGPAQQ